MQPVRQHALDNLRTFIVFLVVVLHASISYMAFAPEWWYVLDPGRSLFFTAVVLLVDVPIMLVMFFLAGYFAFPSLEKRGAGRFLKDKLVRIGIPWAFGALVLAPPTAYMIYFSRKAPLSLLDFWRTEFWGRGFQQSVYWYLGVLLAFFALAALLFKASPRFARWPQSVRRPGWGLLGGFLLAVTAASALVGLARPLDQWSHVYLFVYQPVRVPLYIGYFALGLAAQRQGWFTEGGYTPALGPWLAACILSGLAYLAWRLAPHAPGPMPGVATVALFNLFCFTSLMGGAALFLRFGHGSGPLLGSQARNSYGVYYLHPLFLYPLALLFVPLQMSIYAKAAAITVLAYLASWGTGAALLTRLPGLRRMF